MTTLVEQQPHQHTNNASTSLSMELLAGVCALAFNRCHHHQRSRCCRCCCAVAVVVAVVVVVVVISVIIITPKCADNNMYTQCIQARTTVPNQPCVLLHTHKTVQCCCCCYFCFSFYLFAVGKLELLSD